MKKILIIINVVIGLILVILLLRNLLADDAPAEANDKKSVALKNARKGIEKKQNSLAGKKADGDAPKLLSGDEAVDKIISANIFNGMRSPLSTMRAGRPDMVLLGTFLVGDIKGAIIRQSGGSRQINPYIAQMIMMSGGGPNGSPGGGFGGRRRAFGSGNNMSANQPLKQYVRVGETMNNGYTLMEISRTHAVLVRGNDKIELELQDPSKNRVSGSSSGGRSNPWQQMQQAQMFMQSQMLRSLQRMEQNTRQNNGNSGNGNRGRGRR